MKFLLPILMLTIVANAQNEFPTPYEKGNKNQTATYEEAIAYLKLLDQNFETISVTEQGPTDSGEPLHQVVFSANKVFGFEEIHKSNAVLLINNGIHPGEPDGIDATMILFRDLALRKIKVPKNVVIVAIPVYNIGGALNRGSFSRANQNGPESYGFRGNARNYDLNRDFVKSDTRNARSFAAIFQQVDPDVFIDNHVSNGANYQYTFTYIATHHQKLGGQLGAFWRDEMMPEILTDLKRHHIESVPYVNIHGDTPDNGFDKFMDHPRYSTGYASMFNTLGSMPETHMLKNYQSRVKATLQYMVSTMNYTDANWSKIKKLRAAQTAAITPGTKYTVQWTINRAKQSNIPFLGYEAKYKPSDISGKTRLYYDESKPFAKQVPFFEEYKSSVEIIVPTAYIIPKSWWNVIDLLKNNQIEMTSLPENRTIQVESYRIADYKTATGSYEGHYPHHSVQIEKSKRNVQFKKGDFLISTNQPRVKMLLETLEPQAVDSYFNWNFFDAILQQKEYFSNYVFEDLAKSLLDKNQELKAQFENKKLEDKIFADSGDLQLDWIYKNSEYYEKSHLQYPVYRVID